MGMRGDIHAKIERKKEITERKGRGEEAEGNEEMERKEGRTKTWKEKEGRGKGEADGKKEMERMW